MKNTWTQVIAKTAITLVKYNGGRRSKRITQTIHAILFGLAVQLICASTAQSGEVNPCAAPIVADESKTLAQRTTFSERGEPTYVINSTADTTDGACNAANCTLREALQSQPAGIVFIQFALPLFSTPQTINLLTALPNLSADIRLRGPGAKLLTVQRGLIGTGEFSVFTISPGDGNVVMCGLTIRQGFTPQDGGGIYSQRFLYLFDVHVTSNGAQRGGGVALIGASGDFSGSSFSGNIGSDRGGAIYIEPLDSSFAMNNSTVSGNRSNNAGGGIAIGGNSTGNSVVVSNCTIANNMVDAANTGAGIFDGTTSSRPTRLQSNLFANNMPLNLSGNAIATVISEGFNLSSDDGSGLLTQSTDKTLAIPGLSPLADNGGQTPTHGLLSNSAAIDAGISEIFNDQRGPGFLRLVDLPAVNAIGGNGTDIGAFEVQANFDFKNGFESL
jgi:CSLREA domain-containing protein